jgi:hypothetical protein
MTLRCPTCGHEAVSSPETEKGRKDAERALARIGAVLAGPFCIECHKAGRGDVELRPAAEVAKA